MLLRCQCHYLSFLLFWDQPSETHLVSGVANIDTNKVVPTDDVEANIELEINIANEGDVATQSLMVILGYYWPSHMVEEYVTRFFIGLQLRWWAERTHFVEFTESAKMFNLIVCKGNE